jgi:hypothetical protein
MKLKRLCLVVVSILISSVVFLAPTSALAASLIVSPDNGPVNTAFHVSGSGFTPTVSYDIFFPYNTPWEEETGGTVAVDGSISRFINVPEIPGGSYTVRVETDFESASDTFEVEPEIELGDSTVQVGDQVVIHGTGFRANRDVAIRFDNRTEETARTNSRGRFSDTFRVPEADRGSHDVSADDGIFEAEDSLSVRQSISISPNFGTTGTEVRVTGRGFRDNRTIGIFFDGNRIDARPSSVRTDSDGSFNAEFDVPFCANRTPEVLASDGTYTASAVFTIVANIMLSPISGEVEDEVSISGRGFRSNRVIEITFDGNELATRPSVVRSDDTGCFDATFLIPPSTTGTHEVSASDGDESDEANLTTQSTLMLSPSSGPINATVSVTGTGFGPSRTVTIRFNGEHVRTGATDAQGKFTDQFMVPSVSSGNYDVNASDGSTTAVAVFTVTTSLEVTPSTGNVGSSITVTGTGFTGTVVIEYDDTTVTTTRADANGNFAILFSAPPSRYGQHTISASDAINTLEITFIMESNPPPTPQFVSPENGSRQGSRPTFVWSEVSDPSGVTYTLQIAPDGSFVTLVLEKRGLTQTQYTLAGEEALRATDSDAPYYWRVRAIDGAENESNWTGERSFYVRYLPLWALIVIVAVVSVVVAVLVTRRIYKR